MSVLAVECAGSRAVAGDAVRYRIHDHLTVAAVPAGTGTVSVWQPVISDSPYQRVLDVVVSSSVVWSLTKEPGHGNAMLYTELDDPRSSTSLDVIYSIERLPIQHSLEPACARRLANPDLFARHLGPEEFVNVDERTRALAREVAKGETNPLLQARAFYDHVTGTMTYDASNQSWKGSTEHALVCSVGNCNDIHALFISLCRSAGIPARLVMGQALEATAPGEEPCDLCGYHCWAEFFVAGLGWIPADASCACKYGEKSLFGALPTNHIAWSQGRDLTLAPAQNGPPLLYFPGPYAEVDGRAWGGVDRHVRFDVG